MSVGQDNAAPSLHGHYSHFSATTGCSVPVSGFGILPRGVRHLRISLNTPSQVPWFRIEARDEIMPFERWGVKAARVTLNWKIKFQCLQRLEEGAHNDSFVVTGRIARSTVLVSSSMRPSGMTMT